VSLLYSDLDEGDRERAAKFLANELAKSFIQDEQAADDYADDIAINGDPSATDHGGIWEHVKDLEPIETDVHEFDAPNPPPSFGEGYAIAQRMTRDALNSQIERMILEKPERMPVIIGSQLKIEPNPVLVSLLRRTLQLLRTIRQEGYTPHGAGTIAISERIEELEELVGGCDE
jgi:hypothetical protein